MAEWPGPGGAGGYDYVQSKEPPAPIEGEEWYDPDTNESKVYDGANWHLQTVGDFNELAGKIAAAQIPDAVLVARMLSADSVTAQAIASAAIQTGHIAADAVTSAKVAADAIQTGHIAADAVTGTEVAADAVGSGQVANGAIDPLHLSFDPASQTELNNHEATDGAHHSYPVPSSGIAIGAINQTHLSFTALEPSDRKTAVIDDPSLATRHTQTVFDGANSGTAFDTTATWTTVSKQTYSAPDANFVWPYCTYECTISNSNSCNYRLIVTAGNGNSVSKTKQNDVGTFSIDTGPVYSGGTDLEFHEQVRTYDGYDVEAYSKSRGADRDLQERDRR